MGLVFPGQGPEDGQGGSGDCPDDKDLQILDLHVQVRNLQAENLTLQEQVDKLTLQMEDLSIASPEKEETMVSDEAVRKRLMRICGKKTDGNLRYNLICPVAKQFIFSKSNFGKLAQCDTTM